MKAKIEFSKILFKFNENNENEHYYGIIINDFKGKSHFNQTRQLFSILSFIHYGWLLCDYD